ncbi:ABC transporter permease [Paracoccus jiaweipingae]|uniref:ABC transporter permease n=1 Tax=unclassified Paracoccus (in: a-proteobacteria) TaxID=2688777 RepID=UPI0037BBC93B
MSALSRILAIAGQEIRLARRNRWLVLAMALLTLFALSLSVMGAGQGAALAADAMQVGAAGLATLSVYLVPLIALLLSYDSIAGEVERGTLALTLATPLRRWEMFVAKFAAQTGIVALAVLLGFGIAGAVVAAFWPVGADGLAAWARLMATSVLLGAVFVAMGLAVSARAGRTATAAALAVGLWLVLVVLYDLALLGGVMVDRGGTFTTQVFPWAVLANPADAFRLYNLALVETAPVAGIDGLSRSFPAPVWTALLVLAGWLAGLLALGIAFAKRIVP